MTIILYKYSEIIKTFCRDSVIFIRFWWTCLNMSHLFWTAYISVGTFFHLSEATNFKRFELSCCVYPVMLCAWFPLHIIAVSLVDLLTTKWNPCTSKVKDCHLALNVIKTSICSKAFCLKSLLLFVVVPNLAFVENDCLHF